MMQIRCWLLPEVRIRRYFEAAEHIAGLVVERLEMNIGAAAEKIQKWNWNRLWSSLKFRHCKLPETIGIAAAAVEVVKTAESAGALNIVAQIAVEMIAVEEIKELKLIGFF